MSDLPTDQKRIFDFLLEHLRTKEPFTKEEMLEIIENWKDETIVTYWSKIYKQLLIPLEDGKYRVSDVFRKYTTVERFKKLTSQSRRSLRTNYQKINYKKVIIFEFFMPLVNESYLRDSLDTLFYKDTILTRLKNIVKKEDLEIYFPRAPKEEDEIYYKRVCDWISDKFIGYSILHVSGRFRNGELKTLSEAADLQKIGISYLIDETTAIVKFIFPVGPKIIKEIPDLLEYSENRDDDEDKIRKQIEQEAKCIRWLFNVLFVYNIVELVGEDEIWMVESGIRNQLHIWRAIDES